MNNRKNNPKTPVIGMLGWELRNDGTLSQLEEIPGNIVHPDTFDFPILYKRVDGAYYQTVVVQPNKKVLAAMISTAKQMKKEGVRAIMTNCGFNAIFQKELANAVKLPVFASSLIQVPLVHSMLKKNQIVGIITADKKHLTKKHLRNAGITDKIPVKIAGIENTEEFSKARDNPEAVVDMEKFGREVVETAAQLFKKNKNIGAIVLECTDLPPFSSAIRETLGLPVFDIVTLAHMIYESICGNRWK